MLSAQWCATKTLIELIAGSQFLGTVCTKGLKEKDLSAWWKRLCLVAWSFVLLETIRLMLSKRCTHQKSRRVLEVWRQTKVPLRFALTMKTQVLCFLIVIWQVDKSKWLNGLTIFHCVIRKHVKAFTWMLMNQAGNRIFSFCLATWTGE